MLLPVSIDINKTFGAKQTAHHELPSTEPQETGVMLGAFLFLLIPWDNYQLLPALFFPLDLPL